MSIHINFDPVGRITTGAIGEPGQRVFYLQAGAGAETVTLVMEKFQVAALASHIEQLLTRLSQRAGQSEEDEDDAADLALIAPLEPAFRVGEMALGYDAGRDLVLLQCKEAMEAEEPETVAEDPIEREFQEVLASESQDVSTATFWATREQMRALARVGMQAVEAGRPICRLCGNPMDPEGHQCPSTNGHRKLGR